jgi:protein TonB
MLIHVARPLLVLLVVGIVTVFGQGTPKKVSRAEALNAVTVKIQPEYPAMAKQLKLEGTVELEVSVTETGTVESVTITSGNPVLTRPAVDAVKKWKFAPFIQEGKTVKAVAPVTIIFKL